MACTKRAPVDFGNSPLGVHQPPPAIVFPVPCTQRPGLLKRVIEAFGRHLRYRRAKRHLAFMTEYQLHDIGLTRSHIDQVVRYGRRE
jgi:uncharacterized protein YjiS (DUF1127 family)